MEISSIIKHVLSPTNTHRARSGKGSLAEKQGSHRRGEPGRKAPSRGVPPGARQQGTLGYPQQHPLPPQEGTTTALATMGPSGQGPWPHGGFRGCCGVTSHHSEDTVGLPLAHTAPRGCSLAPVCQGHLEWLRGQLKPH